jgi:hypothetical protein
MTSRRNWKYFHSENGRLELLEPRNMLAGHALGAAFSHATHDFAALAAVHAPSATAASGKGAAHAQSELTATLTDSDGTATGTVTLETYGGHCGGSGATELNVSVTGAAASSSLDVAIDGTVVGTLTTDANGAGTVSLKSKSGDALSAFTAANTAGLGVTIGTLSGTFAASDDGGDDSSTTVTKAAGLLTDSVGTATGRAKLSVRTEDGSTSTKFSVYIRGADANTTLDVAIDGTVVGQITTDGNGAGKLKLSSKDGTLPDNFPTTAGANSTVTVGTTSGTLSAVDFHSEHHFGRGRRR